LLNRSGQSQAALEQYEEALRRKPGAPLVHANLAALLLKLGRSDEAIAHFEEAVRLDPRDPRLQLSFAKALLRLGRDAEAVGRFQDALRLDPNDSKALVYLARVLAADSNPRVRNAAESVNLARRANDLTSGDQPFVLDTLAMAYAESGRFPEATNTLQRAIQRAAAAGDNEAVSAMQQRLHLYESGQPFRQAFTNTPPEDPSGPKPSAQ